jgi:hypothetical protein
MFYIHLFPYLKPGPEGLGAVTHPVGAAELHYLSDSVWASGRELPSDGVCEDWWWANLVYLSNFLPLSGEHGQFGRSAQGTGCMDWSWFLSVDFQLQILVNHNPCAVWVNTVLKS